MLSSTRKPRHKRARAAGGSGDFYARGGGKAARRSAPPSQPRGGRHDGAIGVWSRRPAATAGPLGRRRLDSGEQATGEAPQRAPETQSWRCLAVRSAAASQMRFSCVETRRLRLSRWLGRAGVEILAGGRGMDRGLWDEKGRTGKRRCEPGSRACACTEPSSRPREPTGSPPSLAAASRRRVHAPWGRA